MTQEPKNYRNQRTSGAPMPRLVAENEGLIAVNIGKSFKKRPVLRGVSLALQRGEDQMNGRYAEVDLKTGISRMLGAAPGQPGDTRVRTLLVPSSDPEEQGSGENATGAEGTKGKGAGKKSGS